MICPNCGSHISDDTEICPACRANVEEYLERRSSGHRSLQLRYCANCGALLDAQASTCPHCGIPCEDAPFPKPVDGASESASEDEEEIASQLEGTLPAEKLYLVDDGWQDVAPYKIVLLLIICMGLLAYGITYFVSHPWDLLSSPVSEEQPVDDGPKTIDRLTGQDSNRGLPADGGV